MGPLLSYKQERMLAQIRKVLVEVESRGRFESHLGGRMARLGEWMGLG